MGDALLQKTYTVDFLTKKRSENQGQVNQYYLGDLYLNINSTTYLPFIVVQIVDVPLISTL